MKELVETVTYANGANLARKLQRYCPGGLG
jgi:hypothetical protein